MTKEDKEIMVKKTMGTLSSSLGLLLEYDYPELPIMLDKINNLCFSCLRDLSLNKIQGDYA